MVLFNYAEVFKFLRFFWVSAPRWYWTNLRKSQTLSPQQLWFQPLLFKGLCTFVDIILVTFFLIFNLIFHCLYQKDTWKCYYFQLLCHSNQDSNSRGTQVIWLVSLESYIDSRPGADGPSGWIVQPRLCDGRRVGSHIRALMSPSGKVRTGTGQAKSKPWQWCCKHLAGWILNKNTDS